MVDVKDTETSLGTFLTKRDIEAMHSRSIEVKNKKITAEEILQEAQEQEFNPSKQQKNTNTNTNTTELAEDFHSRKRKKFEDSVGRKNSSSDDWIKYAEWEESQKDYARTRSVYERALFVHSSDQTLMTKYAEVEIRRRFISQVRRLGQEYINSVDNDVRMSSSSRRLQSLRTCVRRHKGPVKSTTSMHLIPN